MLVFLLGFLVVPVLAWPAAAEVCPRVTAPVKVDLVVVSVDPRVDHGLSQAQIQDIGREVGVSGGWRKGGSGGRQWRTVGLTRGELGLGLQIEAEMRERGGRYCVVLHGLTVNVGYRVMDILVPRSYPRGSCQYRAIMSHEREHVRINHDVLREFIGPLRAQAVRAAEAVNPIPVRGRREARSKPLELLTERLRPVLEEFRVAQRRANAAIDTAAEYDRIKGRCGRW